MSLRNLVKKFKKEKKTLFTTPTHSQGAFIVPENKKYLGKKIFKRDYSEIDGFDNLSNPTGEILEAEMRASEIYGSIFSFFLVNGSTSGIIASMLAVLKKNDKVIVARNSHKAIYNGLVLTGAKPVWLMPEYKTEWDVFEPLEYEYIKATIESNPDAKAIILTNPSYEGIAISDIKAILKYTKEKGLITIIDEAHGALWNYTDRLMTPSIRYSADITIQSLHKTAGALNPSAIMHLSKNSNIKKQNLQNALNLITTTSPSYPILLNIENTIEFLASDAGRLKINKLIERIDNFKASLAKYKNIHIYSENNDKTKLLVKIDNLTGYKLSEILSEKYNIEDEMATSKAVLFLTGIGTKKLKLTKLKYALINISKTAIENETPVIQFKKQELPDPITKMTPSEAFIKESKKISKEESVGMIAKELIIQYPPGIPIVVPGEVIQKEHLKFLNGKKDIEVVI